MFTVLAEGVWPPAGFARQISVSSNVGDQLDSSGSKQSGTCGV